MADLSGPEKATVPANALKSLSASRFPDICCTADAVEQSEDGYRLTGMPGGRGNQRAPVVELRTEDLGDSWRLAAESNIRESDYCVKPYSMLMGSIRVADEVTVLFTAIRPKGE